MFLVLLVLTLVSLSLTAKDEPSDETRKTLDLSNKQLTSLRDYDFSKYPLLEELDLSNNLIENIKEDKFKDNKHLIKLNLSGNRRLELPKFSTLLIADLEYLNLSDCDIEDFPPSILDGLTHLRVIDLSKNRLKKAALITFSNLQSLEKIILPNFKNKQLITEICTELKQIILISDKEILPCADVQNGKWETLENGTNLEPHNEHEPDENISTEEQETSEINDEPDTPNQNVPNIVTDTEPDVPDTQIINKEIDKSKITGTNKTDLDQIIPKAPNTIESKPEAQKEIPESEVVKTVNNEVKPNDSQPLQETDRKPPIDTKSNNTPESGVIKNIVPLETDNEKSNKNKDTEVVPLVAQVLPPQEPAQEKSEVPAVAIQRIAPQSQPAVENSAISSSPIVSPIEVNQVPQAKQEDISEPPTGASTPPSTRTNILIILVIAVIISGIAAFGYRFYKTRTYRATSTQEPVERELQEIVTDKKSNIVEQEPLMQKNENGLEVNETKGNEVNHTTANSKPYVPITSITADNVK